ncbi:MAG: hypothetical protein NDJ89_05835 [Oligoflexia bacterium]|nr:hypothetical protein [Oligoflexia bacterium]
MRPGQIRLLITLTLLGVALGLWALLSGRTLLEPGETPERGALATHSSPGETSRQDSLTKSPAAIETGSAASPLPSGAPPAALEDIDRAQAESLFRTPVNIPELPRVRDEIAREPHVTPPALVSFGAELGARLTIALESESHAREFLTQLKACVEPKPTGTLPAAEAMCLLHAEWVTERYAGLAPELAELKTQASAEARAIHEKMAGGEKAR